MYFKMPCWKCGRPLRASDEIIGKKARCPYCGTVGEIRRPEAEEGASLAVPTPATAGTLAPDGTQVSVSAEKREGGQSRGTNVSLMFGAILGLAGTAVFYLVFILPIPDNPVRQRFADRGLVPYAITFLSFWAWSILVLKYLRLRVQQSALLFDVLPTEVAEEIRQDNVEAFRANILSLPIKPENSFLIGRVLRALNQYKVHPTRESVSTLLENQSDIEANIVESSYTMVKVLVWAIPILGFIGTVMGVGGAVSNFSGVIAGAADFSAVKSQLADVTTNLGVAFDTTLVALVMSLLVMFPASGIQKMEEDLLSSVDQYCNENILRRVRSSSSGDRSSKSAGQANHIDGILVKRANELRQWAKGLETMSQKMSREIASSWQKAQKSVREAHLSEVTAATDSAETLARTMDGVFAKPCQELQERIKDLDAMSKRMTSDIADAWKQAVQSVEETHRSDVTATVDSCQEMVGSVSSLQSELTGASERILDLNEAQQRLAEVNQRLLENAEILAGDGAIKGALAGVEQQLARNSEVLVSLGEQLGSSGKRKRRRWGIFSRKKKKTNEAEQDGPKA